MNEKRDQRPDSVSGRWSASQFLCKCLSAPDENRDAITRELRRQGFDWTQVIHVGSEHFVLPALYLRLRLLGLLSQLPSDVAAALEGIYELNCQRNELILAELANSVRILNEAGIEPVALKGAAYLISGVYPDPGARILADIDLLVQSNVISAVLKALRAHQFQLVNPEQVPSHHYVLIGPLSGVVLELHFQLGARIDKRVLPSAEVLLRSRPVSFRGTAIRIPSAEHLLVHHSLHSQLHHGVQRRMLPLFRDLTDLLSINQRFGSNEAWDATAKRFRSAHRLSILEAYLYDAERMIGFNVPNAINASVLARMRLLHRKVVRRHPWLLYVDPTVIFEPVFRDYLDKGVSLRYRRTHALGPSMPTPRSYMSSFVKRLSRFLQFVQSFPR